MPRDLDSINQSCINEGQMRILCSNFGMSGQYVEYRPASDNPYAGMYFVCGTPAKVKEVAANNTYSNDNNHIDPAWVSRRSTRNPDFFYTDVFALNVSDMPTIVALDKIHQYCQEYEALHTIFKEFGKEIPKKIHWSDVKAIEELNKGRYNRDYIPELRQHYTDRLKAYLEKNFSNKAVQRINADADLAGQSNFVDISYFAAKRDDIRYVTLKEESFQYLKKTLEKNPQKYKDIKIYAGKVDVIDYGIKNTPGEYNPWANFENHYEERTIGYRNCDESTISGILLQNHCHSLTNVTHDRSSFFTEPCVALTLPVSYLDSWDANARKEGMEYYVDVDYIYGNGELDTATIIYHEEDEDKVTPFFNGIMAYTSHEHSEYLGQGQPERVRFDIPKGNLEDLIKQANTQDKKPKHGLFGKNKDAR